MTYIQLTCIVQLTCIATALDVLNDGPIFFGIARRQERGRFVCKYRQTEETKTKV